MLTIISPAKTLDFEQKSPTTTFSIPHHIDKSELLVGSLKKKSPKKLAELMNISPKLAQLNFDRFQEWDSNFHSENAIQAAFVFKGDVYMGLDIKRFLENDLLYAQKHLRILSGLHGVLKPLDLIKPYRLEMGTKLKYRRKNDLYEFWGDLITENLNQSLKAHDERILINLASTEYFRSINPDKLKARIITPVFKEFKNGSYRFMSFFGKKARGMMARYIMMNKISNPEDLKFFEEEGYYYNDNLSKGDELVFTRG